ncbi:ABC transporter substrate-binding protein [Allonocardiopsis opalescens]|uniref:Peptide/nickel transport system substrate-binding protein n=1 Tax=Allonocardiopsis opalescens TaxID=1144618 RepID=A0A2T0PYD7_9ACTN|nr:ABC transporter substrate-binding protein [Allonocardiopsis opalescens]PRX96556.1 peptide/nickel transport system substrate-binding protein [Allonocardiopsis opalescens]
MSQFKPRRPATGAAIAVLAIALTACGGPGGSQDEGAATLTFGVQAPPNSLDPAQLHDGTQRYVWGSLYDTLIYSDNEGELQPAAAESWEYSEDARTLTLRLRDDMTFSDGDPVTSEAVRVTLERTRDTAGPQQNNLGAIESVDTPDEHTVVLNLSEPDPNLLVALAFGSGVIGDPDTIDDESTALNPVGSGPYVLNREETVDGSTYVLERRDDHWNADAYPFETVTVRAIQDRTALFNALLTGELDAGTVDETQAGQVERAGFTLQRVDGISVGQIVIADRAGEVVPALADVRVRQAINLAFDRQGIIDAIFLGLGQPTTQIFNTLSPAFVEELNGEYEYAPDRARELLAEAGYPDGFTLTMPANLFVQQVQPTITQALADIGITVEWEPVPAQQSGQTTNWGMYFNLGAVAPPSRTVALYFEESGSQNPFGTTDPELDGLLEDLAAETDPEAANGIYREINAFAVENAWSAPIFLQSTNWATRDGVEYVGTANALFDIRVFALSR